MPPRRTTSATAGSPKKNAKKNYSMFRIFETALEGKMKMLYVMGQNPMVTNPNLNLVP